MSPKEHGRNWAVPAQKPSVFHIVQLNRRTGVTLDEPAVVLKFGVTPESIPDYLALVGGQGLCLAYR